MAALSGSNCAGNGPPPTSGLSSEVGSGSGSIQSGAPARYDDHDPDPDDYPDPDPDDDPDPETDADTSADAVRSSSVDRLERPCQVAVWTAKPA